jgi:hypothetical protein
VRAVGLVDQLVVVDDYSTDGKREVLEAESHFGIIIVDLSATMPITI